MGVCATPAQCSETKNLLLEISLQLQLKSIVTICNSLFGFVWEAT